MLDALKSYLALVNSVSEVTRQRAVAVAQGLVQQGEATAGQVSELAEEMLTQSRQNRDAVATLVRSEVDRALGRVGLAQIDEVTQLTERVHSLEATIRDLRASSAPAAGSGATAAHTTTEAPRKKTAARAATSAGARMSASKAAGAAPSRAAAKKTANKAAAAPKDKTVKAPTSQTAKKTAMKTAEKATRAPAKQTKAPAKQAAKQTKAPAKKTATGATA